MEYPWTLQTMRKINELTPEIKGKAFDPDWFLLRQRFETMEEKMLAQGIEWDGEKWATRSHYDKRERWDNAGLGSSVQQLAGE